MSTANTAADAAIEHTPPTNNAWAPVALPLNATATARSTSRIPKPQSRPSESGHHGPRYVHQTNRTTASGSTSSPIEASERNAKSVSAAVSAQAKNQPRKRMAASVSPPLHSRPEPLRVALTP
jgi:hypothetical protein